MEEVKGRRLILFPMPLQGHINPMLDLANILHSKGFSITILHTTFNPLDPSIHPHFKFHSIPVNLSESVASTKNLVHLFNLLNAKLVEPFKDYLASLLSDDLNSQPVACLISDDLLYFTQPIAESLKLPRLVLKTECVTCINVFSMFPLLREKGYLHVQDARLKDPVKELPPLKVKDLPVVKGCDLSEYYDLVVPISSNTQASDGLIFNTFEDLEETSLVKMRQEHLPNVPIFPIGPFHKYSQTSSSSSSSQDQTCIPWLNNQAPKSVIYVSFGTIAKINQPQFLEVAWGLANSNQPFLWVVRAGLVIDSEWLESLPTELLEILNRKGHIVKWASQKEVLAHPAVGAFWTHNGWNSTLESICEGVPMISTPFFNDQMVVARYVSEVWKVGLWLEDGIERGLIEKTIRKLMVEKEGKEIKERMSKLQVKANRCLKHGGSSDQSLEELVKYISSFKPFAFKPQRQ